MSTATPTPSVNPSVEICRNLFGRHPEDVIAPIDCASDTLSQLVEIFNTISNEALNGHNAYRIKYLAKAGSYIANDIDNYLDCEFESMRDRLREVGIVAEKGGIA